MHHRVLNEALKKPTVYEKNLREHCEVAALILKTLPQTTNTMHHVKAAIRRASDQVAWVKGGHNHIKALFMSHKAELQMKEKSFENLIAEHLVPVKLMTKKVEKIPISEVSWEAIRTIVMTYTVMALVTKSEDEALRNLGLVSSMPKDWDGVDPFARYTAAGIELKENNYSSIRRAFS